MEKFLLKIIVVIFVGSLIGGAAFYFWKNKYIIPASKEAIGRSSRNEQKENLATSGSGNKKITNSNEAEIISYIEKNINRLVARGPVVGEKWHPVKIWIIDDKNFYVDYKSDANGLGRILILQLSRGAGASYEVIGHFIPGEKGWILESGKDIASTAPIRLYEKNEQSDEWTVK